jgi:3-deoxy-D-manno-octulosonic-acid transferase
MIRFIYNLLWPIGLLLFLPGYLVKMFRRGGYREKFGQRLGLYDVDLAKRLTNPLWLHAVSVGEVAIALKLAAKLPGRQIVLTITTTTGFAFARQNAPASIEVMYSPLDFWPIMRRAFNVIRPERIVLVEAEVWPNMVAEAHKRNVPIALVNARLSPRSEARFLRFVWFVRPIFRLLDLVCVQNEDDVGRWKALGAERIVRTGSIKYDPEDVDVDPTLARNVLLARKIDIERPVLLGGSTHFGEEETLAKVFLQLRSYSPDLLLILAPRHAERARSIANDLRQRGLSLALRSLAPASPSHGGQDRQSHAAPDCLLIDTTGELRHWYAIARVIFIGKSLTARGGQNPAEAIIAGRPVVFGTHMENFRGFADVLVARGGAVQVNSAEELRKAIVDLLRHPERREELVRKAREVLSEHRGATARTAQLIVDLAKRARE